VQEISNKAKLINPAMYFVVLRSIPGILPNKGHK
jgi:hypothetical protein